VTPAPVRPYARPGRTAGAVSGTRRPIERVPVTSTASSATAIPSRSQAQRRILTVLVDSQALSGAGITVGALLAQDVARGCRPGLAAGYLTGAIGSDGVIAATVASYPLLAVLPAIAVTANSR
jgi:hypothetical protein